MLQHLRTYYEKVPAFLKNKFAITAIVFALWMLFFDRYDVITQYKLRKELREIEKDKNYYKDEVTEVEKMRDELFNSPQNLERFARENYLMKKDNEVVFIIVEED